MALHARNLTKTYGQQKALNDVSFDITKGEVIGLLGPNGAGKSTLMKILTGYTKPDTGDFHINNTRYRQTPDQYKSMIGYLPEHNPLYPHLYVREFLRFIAGFYKIDNPKDRVDEVTQMVGLTPEAHKTIGNLSKGYKQRVGLAQALLHDPEILILDEPTTGLDPNQIVEIRHLIKEISQDKTILLSTHIMQEVEALCNRVMIISHGKLVANSTINTLQDIVKESISTVEVTFHKTLNPKTFQHITAISNVEEMGVRKFRITSERDIRVALFELATQEDNPILTMQPHEQKLESVFRHFTHEHTVNER